MNPAQLPLNAQLVHLRKVLSSNPTLLAVLARARALDLPDWYLAAGALSQTIWNSVSGNPAETGIRDYDLVYFSPDASYEAEDAVIRRGRTLFADVPADVEIRNQARVHLWYETKFGAPCEPHRSVEAGIDTWISTSAMIGVRVEGDGEWSVYAPRGLSDFFNMIVRPNPDIGTREKYEEKGRRWMGIWTGLTVMPWPADGEKPPKVNGDER
ncbi:hypothetical protein Cob_v003324 [Colletotrichum orbiculare MAFF 240422]|uniref:FAD binding domain protein n=1 Tax=Colletotrichum orbiculare (strain 104-T / ATCC 96160 / CBS 514.97 / LARS 414 / MAFF 240422) TaxID=1213857 RepID=N4VT77_COLOR|nr:hypothetical protein Cob_v003324 [Colletotrichum orbiculare MAFF 240422]